MPRLITARKERNRFFTPIAHLPARARDTDRELGRVNRPVPQLAVSSGWRQNPRRWKCSEYSDADIPLSLEPQPKERCRRRYLCCRRLHHVLEDDEVEIGYDSSLPRPEPTFRDWTLNRYPDGPCLYVQTYVPGSGPPLTRPTLLLFNEVNKAAIIDTFVRMQGLRKTIFYQLMYPDEGDVKVTIAAFAITNNPVLNKFDTVFNKRRRLDRVR
ncbi:hypothetical protein B0T26DRAFT_803415 [Lasiosphaeria miniovina]|uniref:Uncharacterized protein n=1 Tax=Lasiosphaeria miniovina TaxID=1954250 RepID=A0AA40AMK2_9PEZI|nr:uncharacterized protein B0T26DRAFT_803415 [Lasiosphaeria miniovina]KAK0718621.1 hypothetical protein B0T26DRAFT_803415 [Lasiosphaeria miniovina]